MNYIISGIGPSNTGVGEAMKFIVKSNKKEDIKILYPPKRESVKEFFRQREFVKLFNEISRRLKFSFLINSIRKSKVILLHPQTLGFNNTKRLIMNNKVSLFIMDNSFFCIRSYNHLNGSFRPCLKCLDNNFMNIYKNKCRSFPAGYSVRKNVNFCKFLIKYSNKIEFISQNKHQELLIKKHFKNCKTTVIGLFTNDMLLNYRNFKETKKYDLVYHGSAIEAKGIVYFLKLVSKSDYSAFAPIDEFELNNLITKYNIKRSELRNLEYYYINWETGLKEIVQNCKVVLCPSLWSAPIEGALIKSFLYNGVVAVVDSEYSYSSEIPHDCKINLPQDVEKGAKILEKYCTNDELLNNIKQNGIRWVTKFITSKNLYIQKLLKIFED